MYKNIENIHYCTILSAEQWNFLLDSKSSVFRLRCLHKLMTDAIRTETSYSIKGIQVTLEVGQVAASDVELSVYLGCNRKTAGKLIDSFNRLGMLTTMTNNRTSIHTLHFLTGWYVNGALMTNPHYIKPTANTNRQNRDMRTPVFDGDKSEDTHLPIQSDSESPMQDADSMIAETAPFSSPSCSSVPFSETDNKQSLDDYTLPPNLILEDDNGISV